VVVVAGWLVVVASLVVDEESSRTTVVVVGSPTVVGGTVVVVGSGLPWTSRSGKSWSRVTGPHSPSAASPTGAIAKRAPTRAAIAMTPPIFPAMDIRDYTNGQFEEL
jgi:hypothetical protein